MNEPNREVFPDVDRVKVIARARLLVNAVPGLTFTEATRRARDEVAMIDEAGKVDAATRSGSIHCLAVIKLKDRPGLTYRDAAFQAAAELKARGLMPRHPSGLY